MKKLLLATAVAALSVSAAQAAPTIYGKAFMTADYYDISDDKGTGFTTAVDNNDQPILNANGGVVLDTYTPVLENTNSSLNSNASRIGVKGGEPLTANTDLVYQLEFGVDADADAGKNFRSRDTYVGLANKQYGTVLAGRLTAIDDMINYANVSQGGVLGGDDVQASFSAPRVNNAAAYVSPNYNGMNFLAMYGNDADQDANSLPGGGWGVGVKYEPAGQPFRAGVTYIHASDVVDSATRVSGAYDINPMMTVGALYQLTDYDTDNNENAFTVSGEMKTASPWTVYAQGDMVNNYGGFEDSKRNRVVLGGKYGFTKATTGHIYGAYLKAENEFSTDSYALKDDNGAVVGTATDYNLNDYSGFGIGAGLEHKF